MLDIQLLESELRLRGFSKETIKSYLTHNKKFIDYIKKQPIQVNESDIKIYLNQSQTVLLLLH